MNIFEPLFLLLVLVTLITLITASVFALKGLSAGATRLLRRLGIGAVTYFAVVIAASALLPQREYRPGQQRCSDDWCIAVIGGRRVAGVASPYQVSVRLSNRARRVPMGEKGTIAYLVDRRGRRFDPIADPETVAFATILQPGTSVVSKILFDVPADAERLGLVYTHAGGFPIGWLIISEGGWFAKSSIMRLE